MSLQVQDILARLPPQPSSQALSLTGLPGKRPTGYVGEYELIQRIAEIQERNVADGYLRLRSDVEREILERQQLFEQEAVSEKPKPQNKPAVVAAGAVAPPATRRREKIGE